MKVQIACPIMCLTFGLALTAATLPAAAADWGGVSNGGIKDFGGAGGVPVPAPIPVPDYKANWYFRLDAGIGVISEPDLGETGFLYGDDAIDGEFGPTRGMLPAWFNGDFNTLLTLGGGAGYYFGNGWRMDATVEKRSKDDAYANGSDEYETYSHYDPPGPPVGTIIWGNDPGGDLDGDTIVEADQHTRIRVSDTTTIKGTVWMLNGYYDVDTGGRFTPYVGAGLGFVWNQLSRTHTNTVDYCTNEVAGPALPGCATGTYTGPVTTTAEDKGDTVTLAAALMAGLSYNISDITKFDVGYRYLFLGGTDATMDIGGTESSFKIGDQQIHQIRAGLRFDVN